MSPKPKVKRNRPNKNLTLSTWALEAAERRMEQLKIPSFSAYVERLIYEDVRREGDSVIGS